MSSSRSPSTKFTGSTIRYGGSGRGILVVSWTGPMKNETTSCGLFVMTYVTKACSHIFSFFVMAYAH
jgi:hypothetical protein